MPERDVHRHLVEASEQLFRLDPGAEIEHHDGWVLGAGRSTHPVISNAAFRTDDSLAPEELLARAQEFFGARGRGFAVWTRHGLDQDQGLIEASERAGLQHVYDMPEMVLDRRAEQRPLPDGVELQRVADAADAAEYWQIATEAYASIGFPPEVFAFYEGHEGLAADNAVAFIAHLDDRPVAIAMMIVSRRVAGIYWVGAREEARGLGLGWITTAAAVNAGFDLGAEIAALQASPMGEGLYRRMGFETLFGYRLFMQPPPG